MEFSTPWKILKTSNEDWIYKWNPETNSILVSNLVLIWGKSYSNDEILAATPPNFKSNSLDQIKDLIHRLLSTKFQPEISQDLILRGQLPLSNFSFPWTFCLPALEPDVLYHHLTLPLLQITKCSTSMISNDSKFYSSLEKIQKQKKIVGVLETSLVSQALRFLSAKDVAPEPSAGLGADVVKVEPKVPEDSEARRRDYEKTLKESLQKKKRKSIF